MLCLFVGDSFASGIASNAASAPCTNNTLETYSGNSNLSADWQPNTINLTWYNEQEKLTVQQSAQSCVYDGTLSIPATQPTRVGYTFAGWKVRLPGTYTELQYIQGTGTQWIDTNFIPDSNTRLRTKLQVDSGVNNSGSCFSGSMGANTGFECFMWSSGTKIYCPYGNHDVATIVATINDTVEIDWNKNIFSAKVNNGDTVKRNFAKQTFTATYQLRLFALSRNTDVATSQGYVKIYYFQVYDNGTLIRDYIPALRNGDGAVGMYDVANQIFYTNPGGDNFVAGPVVR